MSEPVLPLVHTDEAAPDESTGSHGETGSTEPADDRRPLSSVVERRVHIADVVGSTPTAATVIDHIADMLADEAWRLRVEERFWPKVMKPLGWNECWPWTASKKNTRHPYGHFKLSSHRTEIASRVSFALYYNQSPGRLFVCHTCDNPPCVNPTHLFLGTVQDNSDDMVRKGRSAKLDMRGERNHAAKLSEADVGRVKDLIHAGLNNKQIAGRFGVTHQMISRIRRGRSWGGDAIHKPYQHVRRSA